MIHISPGWSLCVAAVNSLIYNGRVTYTTIGIFMTCVVMAVNSWIVPFHSSVVKFASLESSKRQHSQAGA